MKIDSIDHVVLTVKDIEKTCEFYSKVMGMEVVGYEDDHVRRGVSSEGHDDGLQPAVGLPHPADHHPDGQGPRDHAGPLSPAPSAGR